MAKLESGTRIYGNVTVDTFVTATGNVTGGNILTVGVISATGNVAGNFFIGNGSQLTGIATSYGNANVVANLAALGSNPVSTTGNVTGGNLVTSGLISATGNISSNSGLYAVAAVDTNKTLIFGDMATNDQFRIQIGGNTNAGFVEFATADDASEPIYFRQYTGVFTTATRTLTLLDGSGNSLFPGMVSATSNVIGGNLRTAGLISATANITGGNVLTAGLVSATGNSVFSNVKLTKFNETTVGSTNTSTSITPDVSAGTIFAYTANSNFTFNALANAVAGSSATVIITQDATGSRLLTSTMKFANASKTLSTAASSIDIITVFYDGTTYYASLTKGYA